MLYGKKSEQEDAVVFTTLGDTFGTLSFEEIKKRFWSSFHVLNNGVSHLKDGAVVSTTLIIEEQFLTATIGDCVAFVVFYREDGYPLDVFRLNRRTHSVHLPEEEKRVSAAGGRVDCGVIVDPRARSAMAGRLTPSRAIGDNIYGSLVVPADADIDTTSIDEVAHKRGINRQDIAKTQIITTSDGFTEPVDKFTEIIDKKIGHEQLMLASLRELHKNGAENLTEQKIAQHCVAWVSLPRGLTINGREFFLLNSLDNISVCVQTVIRSTPRFVSVIDGHGGPAVAHYVANFMYVELEKLCRLTQSDYDAHPESVMKNQKVYYRDNPAPATSISAKAPLQIEGLITQDVNPHPKDDTTEQDTPYIAAAHNLTQPPSPPGPAPLITGAQNAAPNRSWDGAFLWRCMSSQTAFQSYGAILILAAIAASIMLGVGSTGAAVSISGMALGGAACFFYARSTSSDIHRTAIAQVPVILSKNLNS